MKKYIEVRNWYNIMKNPELNWDGKHEVQEVEPHILIHDTSKDYGDIDTINMLVHGDNFLALKSLEQEYSGRIKCIYIDPPYNTRNIFEHYNDNLDHSTWLSMMYKRLKILHNLLCDDGFICCHIDDSEGHYIKIMLDEIYGRNNYLTTFYIQVRYANKTLAEYSDYHKIIEQIHVYAKNKKLAKLNRPQTEYNINKFKWKIIEKESGERVIIGDREVDIFKPGQYEIAEIQPCLTGLKETWGTGSLARVNTSASGFFERYLAKRKEIDGLCCLYKIANIGCDGLGFRYITGPKRSTANKCKFYSGIPISRVEELKNGKSIRHIPVSNFYDYSGSFGSCSKEGGVGFNCGKKPESLIEMLLNYYSSNGDIILDSFLGSGTTAAVAHKMGRRYIGIEAGDHCYTHCLERLKNVVDGEHSGISKSVNWHGGGGFKFYEVAPILNYEKVKEQ